LTDHNLQVKSVESQVVLLPVPVGRLVIPELRPEDCCCRLSIVLPTFNEAANIGRIIERLSKLLDPEGIPYEIIVVDDDSPDETWRLATEAALIYTKVRVMRRLKERGLSTAVIRGWQAAKGEILAVLDADLQHPPEIVLGLLLEMAKGAELVLGSRHIEGGGVSDWSLARRILSRSAQMLGFLILPEVMGRVSDPMSGCFMLKRSAISGVHLEPTGYKILMEVLARGRVQWIREVGYVFRERDDGTSKVTSVIYIQYLQHLLHLRLDLIFASRLFRFAVVGSSGVIVDMGLLFLLSDPRMLAFGLTRSKIVAAEMAIVNNFSWNDAWTFRDLASTQLSLRAKWRRFLKFNAICLIGLAFNVALLNVLFNFAHMNRYFANALAIVAVTTWNFTLNRKFGWNATAMADEPRPDVALIEATEGLPERQVFTARHF
jgi:dolichol-phosphate mannosyltransferase